MLLLLLFLTLSFPVQATVWSWTDADDNRHFSDKPHKKSQALHINTHDTYHKIKKVYDGDTILLTNSKKIRFLSINTPEVGTWNKPAEEGGEEARKWLVAKLNHQKIRLIQDVKKKDKYGRVLAHIFTEAKEHINLELVKRGLATVNIYPPNLKYTRQLVAAQKQAEQDRKGIWGRKTYAPRAVEEINNNNYRGWQRIVGRVKSIHHAQKYSYLEFSDNFSVVIAIKYSPLFLKMDNYIGKKIEVRGWIRRNKARYSMYIRHPSSMIGLNINN